MEFVKSSQSKLEFRLQIGKSVAFCNVLFCYRFLLAKNVASNKTDNASTCSEEDAKPTTEAGKSENGDEQPPPQKKQRLSNKEYKKLMKGQNKVS